MSEAVYHKVQFGRESTLGTGVAATTIFPAEAGFLGFEHDRATESANEDYGRASREQPGRNFTGIGIATGTLPFTCRFGDIFHILEMHVAGSVAPSGVGPYVYTYTFDETSRTLKPYTVQYGDENSTQDEHRALGVTCTAFNYGFDALSAPGNPMLTGSADLLALNREAAAMTGSLAAPTANDVIEGQYAVFAMGSTATAFASLTAQTGTLKSFQFSSDIKQVPRAYGGTTDVASAYGYSDKPEASFEAMVKIDATRKTNFMDVFEVAGSAPTEQRFRFTFDGAGNNVMTHDLRAVFTAVDLGDHEGERLYAVKGKCVYDATLVGRSQIILTNDISAVP